MHCVYSIVLFYYWMHEYCVLICYFHWSSTPHASSLSAVHLCQQCCHYCWRLSCDQHLQAETASCFHQRIRHQCKLHPQPDSCMPYFMVLLLFTIMTLVSLLSFTVFFFSCFLKQMKSPLNLHTNFFRVSSIQ